MELKQIKIKDFKSIKDLNFPIKGNILSLVGKNECGKSSILEAISFLNPRKVFDDFEVTNKTSPAYEKGFPYLSGLFSMNLAQLDKLIEMSNTYLNESGLAILLDIKTDNAEEDIFFEIERWGNGIQNLSINIIGKKSKKAIKVFNFILKKTVKNEYAENILNNIFPNISLFRDEEIRIKSATINQLKSDSIEYDTLRKLLYIIGCDDFDVFKKSNVHTKCDTFSDKITELFNKYYLQDDSITLKISYQANKVDILVKDESKEHFYITQRSPGFQYFFAFVINKHYSTLNSGTNQIILLDEPGSNLHPKGSRDLLKTFIDISKQNSQIVYTTHNTFLAFRDDIDMLYHIRKKSKVGTYIDKKPYKDNYQELRRELGIMLNDSLLIGELNIIVEGQTELLAIPQLLRSSKFCESENINLEFVNVYNAEGAPEVKSAIRYIDSLDLAGVVLFDSDAAGQRILQNQKIAEILRKRKWEQLSINDVFNDKEERTFEDLFPQNEYVKAYNKFNKDNSDVIEFEKDFEEFIWTKHIGVPIVELLQKHYQSFINEDRRKKNEKFNKVAIMRILLQNVLKLDKEVIDKEYIDILKFLKELTERIEKIEKWLK